MHCVSSIYTITYQVLLRLSPINQYDYNLKLTFMKTPSNKPPPFKNGVFALIFYLHFSTLRIDIICILSSLSTSIPPI